MKFNNIISTLGLLTATLVNASRRDYYGENDARPGLFKILDDHIATIKINMDENEWAIMKEKSYDGDKGEKYGTNNATMEFFVEGTEYQVQLQPGDFTFKLGGRYTRNFAKPGYNIKIENGDIYDVKLLRLRSSIRDVTLMRDKICSDMMQKIDLPSTSTNYANIEVNGENLGIFVLSNKIKKDFIERYYGEKNTKSLYECKEDNSRFEDNSIVEKCQNLNDDLVDQKDEIQQFVDAVNNAKTLDDIKDIIDVDGIIRSFAFEYIILSWDHFLVNGHNYYWYKESNGKWTIILSDFDETLGQNIWPGMFEGDGKYVDKSYIGGDVVHTNIPCFSIREFDMGHKLVKLLIYDDEKHWREVIGDIVKTAFNPKALNKRIDEIRELIHDDVAISRTVDEETGYPLGCYNIKGQLPKWNITHFEEGSEYTNYQANPFISRCLGLKFVIEERFNYLCHTYGIDPETLELIQPQPKVSYWHIRLNTTYDWGELPLFEAEIEKFVYRELDKEDYRLESYNANVEKNSMPPYYIPPTIHEMSNSNTTTVIPTTTTETQATATSSSEVEACWSEKLGYPCCQSTCYAYTIDDDGEWGYENNQWCGIPSSCAKDSCWSKKLGYGCCEGCEAYESDDNGKWGYENNEWCGIIEENCKN